MTKNKVRYEWEGGETEQRATRKGRSKGRSRGRSNKGDPPPDIDCNSKSTAQSSLTFEDESTTLLGWADGALSALFTGCCRGNAVVDLLFSRGDSNAEDLSLPKDGRQSSIPATIIVKSKSGSIM